jgi:predicted dehydrogenase
MKKYRVAVIGATGRGNYGHGLDQVWLELPECELVAVADADEKGLADAIGRLKVSRGYADYRKMLDEAKPDIVSVAPRWIDQHRDMVVAAAERGIHVYMEKPMCRTPREADEMVAACERTNTKLAIAFQTRYSPRLQAASNLIMDGQIGEVLELRGRGKEDRRGGGEDLWVLGSHVMNLIHYFAGEPLWCFASVLRDGQAVGRQDAMPAVEGISVLAGDCVQAMYGMDRSVTAYFGSRRDAAGGRFGLQILGSKGALEILTGYLPAVHYLADPTWSPGRSGKAWQPVTSAGINQPEPYEDGGLHAGNLAACRDLMAAIEEDRQPEASVYEGRVTVEMITAAFVSQLKGGPVSMPLTVRDNPFAS